LRISSGREGRLGCSLRSPTMKDKEQERFDKAVDNIRAQINEGVTRACGELEVLDVIALLTAIETALADELRSYYHAQKLDNYADCRTTVSGAIGLIKDEIEGARAQLEAKLDTVRH